jgi:hypothetical protein
MRAGSFFGGGLKEALTKEDLGGPVPDQCHEVRASLEVAVAGQSRPDYWGPPLLPSLSRIVD